MENFLNDPWLLFFLGFKNFSKTLSFFSKTTHFTVNIKYLILHMMYPKYLFWLKYFLFLALFSKPAFLLLSFLVCLWFNPFLNHFFVKTFLFQTYFFVLVLNSIFVYGYENSNFFLLIFVVNFLFWKYLCLQNSSFYEPYFFTIFS